MEQKRNTTLDLLKVLASFMVVFIHVRFPGEFGDTMNALARFAVPLFFVSSGYFSYQLPLGKIKSRAKSVARLLVFAVILYFLWEIKRFVIGFDFVGLLAHIEKDFNIKEVLELLVFNEPVFTDHLWYLYAIIYVYVVFYLTTKHAVPDKTVFAVSFALLILHLSLSEVFSHLSMVLPTRIVRNFALMGLPFFGTGLYIRKNEDIFKRVPNSVVCVSLALGIFETIRSCKLFGIKEIYIGSLLVLFAVIVLFVKCSDKKYSGILTALSGCSTYIYIFHLIVSALVIRLYGLVGMDYEASVAIQMTHPVIVCFATTILSYGINQIMRKHRVKPSHGATKS